MRLRATRGIHHRRRRSVDVRRRKRRPTRRESDVRACSRRVPRAPRRRECHAPRAADLACWATHAAAATTDGHLVTWGSGLFGQLGRDRGAEPRRVDGGRGVRFVRVARRGRHRAAGGGAVFSFGLGAFGATGHGDRADRHAPCCVEGLRWWARHTFRRGSAALSAGGEVYVWGRIEHDKSGRGEPASSEPAPDARAFPRESRRWSTRCRAHLACGGDHALAHDARRRFGVGSRIERPADATLDGGRSNLDVAVDRALFRGERVVHVSAGARTTSTWARAGPCNRGRRIPRTTRAPRRERNRVHVGRRIPRTTRRYPRGRYPRGRYAVTDRLGSGARRGFLADATYASAVAAGITLSPFSDRRLFERRRRRARREWVSNRRRRFAARIVDGVSRRDRRTSDDASAAPRTRRTRRRGTRRCRGRETASGRRADRAGPELEHRDARVSAPSGSESARLFSALLRATEEVFSSAGFLADGFAIPRRTTTTTTTSTVPAWTWTR